MRPSPCRAPGWFWPRRRDRSSSALRLATVVLLYTGIARAEAPRPLLVSATVCATKVVDLAMFENLLKIELPSTWAMEEETSAEASRLSLDCGPGASELIVSFERGRVGWQVGVDLAPLAPEMRPRTLALATAELIRTAPATPIEPMPPAIAVLPSPMVAAPTPPRPTADTTRAARLTLGLSISFGVTSAALLAAGIPLTAVGYGSNPPLPNSDALKISGIALLAAAQATLAGTAVSLAFWSRARRRPAATVQLIPTSSGVLAIASGSF